MAPKQTRPLPKKQVGSGRSQNPKAFRQRGQQPSRKFISNGDIRRLARRGGVKRISAFLYPEAKEAMFTFLKVILHDAMVFMRHFHRHTIVANDIMHSAKRYGKVAYGV